MNDSAFGNMAKYYDAIFAHKGYDAEADKLFRLMVAGKHQSLTLLELGCGTGEFTRRFKAQGWDVTAGDISATMLEQARLKDVGTLFLGSMCDDEAVPRGKFDAAACMFGAFCYAARDYKEGERALQVVRSRLNAGSRFVLDLMHTSAAASALRHHSSRTAQHGTELVTTFIDKQFDALESVVTTRFSGHACKSDARKVASWSEVHEMRTFTVPEFTAMANRNGFRVERIDRWDESNVDPANPTSRLESNDFYFLAVCEAV